MRVFALQRPPRLRHGGVWIGLLVCLVIVAAAGYGGYRYYQTDAGLVDPSKLITGTAYRGNFDHIVLEQGEIESSENKDIICEVKSRGSGGVSILWVIDEGARVNPGDKLVALDTSELELREKDQRIQVITEEARVATAEAQLEQAKISKEEYLEGVFKTEEAQLLSDISVARQDEEKAKLAMQSSQRLVAKGLMKDLQLSADRHALTNSQTLRKNAEARLKVLRDLTKKKFLVQFDSSIKQAEASLEAAKAELVEEQGELDEVVQQIAKCTIVAPSSGVVVHANKFSSRGGNAEFVVEAGSTVRERQTIIRLPNPERMQIKCNVNESRVTLLKPNMPVKVRVDAIPGLELRGRVSKVNRYAEPGSWYSSSIKEYATFIDIIDPPPNIRTGMTAEAQIFVQQLEDALQIPIEGLYEHGGKMYTLVQDGPQSFQTKVVKLEATNDTMASIEGSLLEDERVVLNLRDHLSLMDLPEIEDNDNSEMRKLALQFGRDQKAAATTTSTKAGEAGGRSDRKTGWDGKRGGGKPAAAGRPNGGRPGGRGQPGRGRPGGATNGKERSKGDGDNNGKSASSDTAEDRSVASHSASDNSVNSQSIHNDASDAAKVDANAVVERKSAGGNTDEPAS